MKICMTDNKKSGCPIKNEQPDIQQGDSNVNHNKATARVAFGGVAKSYISRTSYCRAYN